MEGVLETCLGGGDVLFVGLDTTGRVVGLGLLFCVTEYLDTTVGVLFFGLGGCCGFHCCSVLLLLLPCCGDSFFKLLLGVGKVVLYSAERFFGSGEKVGFAFQEGEESVQ